MGKYRSSLLTAASASTLGEREVRVIAATSTQGRDGHVLVAEGARLANYRKNPIVLWQHDAQTPIGRATSIAARDGTLVAVIEFAASGVSTTADTVCGLVKSGVITTVSVGFEVIDCTPLDPKVPRGGQRVTDWELFEISFCSIPADTGAVVIARRRGTPEERSESDLVLAAAEYGEVLTRTQINHLVGEARRLGVTPSYRYRFVNMVTHQTLNTGADAYRQRQKVAAQLAAVGARYSR